MAAGPGSRSTTASPGPRCGGWPSIRPRVTCGPESPRPASSRAPTAAPTGTSARPSSACRVGPSGAFRRRRTPRPSSTSIFGRRPDDVVAAVEEDWLIRTTEVGVTWTNLDNGTEFDSHTAYFMPGPPGVIISTDDLARRVLDHLASDEDEVPGSDHVGAERRWPQLGGRETPGGHHGRIPAGQLGWARGPSRQSEHERA